jgi:8-amino-7-oxononanoate synthase
MSDPLLWIDREAEQWAERGLQRRLMAWGPSRGGLQGKDSLRLVNLGSNDYLGLAGDERVVAAAQSALDEFGWGAGASPLVTGWRTLHQELADELARFERTEAVALFSSGYAANVGTIRALVGPEDVIYSDCLNHASLIDGARLSGARVEVYEHGDAGHLESLLQRNRSCSRRSLIVTDGVFSMEGALAPLVDLADLADRWGTMLMVDEAHGTGVFGSDGRGASAELGVAERVHVRMGTLSKALGSVGGFVAGSRRLIDWLINHARTLIYSTALPPAAAAAARAALRVALEEPWRRERARTLGASLRRSLADAGLEIPLWSSPIVPVVLGEPDRARAVADRLRDRGYFAPSIRPPSVPDGTSRLRITLTAAHADSDVRAVSEILTTALAGS